MAANPDPARITDAWWWFMEQLVLLEPGTLLGGIFANKAGYHNTRDNLQNSRAHPEWRNDYSIQLPADKRGPADKAAAGDWTFPDAQAGDPTRIRHYGARVKAAFERRDPLLAGWREVLIQADVDKAPEGFDFVTWTTRTPDSTHEWHGHFSELREHAESFETKRNMLAVLGKDVEMSRYYTLNTTDPKHRGEWWMSDGIHRRLLPPKGTLRTLATVGSIRVDLTDADRGTEDWDSFLTRVAGPVWTPGAGGGVAAHTHTVSPPVTG